MEERLTLSQQQKLRQSLSPLQVQYVRLLEMNDAEIEEEVRRELDDNPALEATTDHDDGENESGDEAFNESAEELQLADYGSEDDMPSFRMEANNGTKEERYFEARGEESSSLMEWLMSQLLQTKITHREIEIARFITGDIDDNGYMSRNLRAIEDDVAIIGGIDASPDEVKQVWEKVRDLDPAGVGAVDLRDCLLLQLKRKPAGEKGVKEAKEIINHYFDLFSSMKFDKLQAATGMTQEELAEAMDVIKSLNPKPGATISGSDDELRANHIVPDFIVEADGESLTLTIPNSIPSLQIEKTFADANIDITPRTPRSEVEAMAFIKSKRDEANDFIRAIKMRRETLLRVMTAIMRHQRDFFLTDDELKLRPMILKDIAGETGYDISVVSRATSGKYVATHHGVYPLKFFFNERPKEDSDTSSLEILSALRDLIEKENKKRPLTDEALTKSLNDAGYDIARRTVAKYREKAGIPVARLRRGL